MQICKTEDCTGCFACKNICPKDAITVTQDEYARTLPLIDAEKCISCDLCRKLCPQNQAPDLHKPQTAYAAWSKREEDVCFSSSGGAAAVFSAEVLKSGGVVYGAACADGRTKHIRIDTAQELSKLRGSKYEQSAIGLIYRDVKKQLQDEKKVLFIGVPCQIAGLKAYLKQEYENLLTVDLICHGTPPHAYLEEHIRQKCPDVAFDSYSFRGMYDWKLCVYDKEKIRYQKDRFQDEYYTAFLGGLIFRENCYSCRYARPERISDITIGDFWGLDRTTMKNSYDGRISLCLPNTPKGTAFFERCASLLHWEERTVAEAENEEQWNLLHPSVKPAERDSFLRSYTHSDFDNAVQETALWKNKCREEKELRRSRLLWVRIFRKCKRILKR